MKYLGIDYGTKKIGIAVSDDSGMMAFPRTIVPAGHGALRDIVSIVTEEGIGTIVVGNSLDQSGARNALMEDVDAFVEELYKLTGVPIELHDERFSSTAVRAASWGKPVATPHRSGKAKEAIDDRAAAVMLQRYLDKK